MIDDQDDDLPTQRLSIILELPAWHHTNCIALGAVADVLDRLERDGLRPYRTIIDITELPTA